MENNNDEFEDVIIETADDYEKQSELNDLRQHANKIINGIKQLDSHDMNRAIWELFQNAVDLSLNCHIIIRLTDEALLFSHNGEPFTPMTLDCLFKQVSSKTLEEKKEVYEDKDPLGQYGSGFLTSHVFSKTVVINGGILMKGGFIPLKDFNIDRNTDNWRVLSRSISTLKEKIATLLKQYTDEPIPKPYPRTSFTYSYTNEYNKNAASNAVDSLNLILPYVMALNPNLHKVEVIRHGLTTIYSKKDRYSKGDMHICPVTINEDDMEVCYIESPDKKVTIILPLDQNLQTVSFSEKLPRLFLYYPLIGTENFGVNFIINSRQFQPLEPRNGLYLKSDNDANLKDEKRNRDLLDIASNRIFEFLNANANSILSPSFLATINFNTQNDDAILNNYYKDLKAKWIENFKYLPLVETNSGNISATEAIFLDKGLIEDEGYFNSIFNLAKRFWQNLPKINLITQWTDIVDEWQIEEIKYIKADDLILKIEELGNLEYFEEHDDLITFYRFLLNSGKLESFSVHRLLPNIKGEFRFLGGNGGLNKPLNITKDLIDIADVIMPDGPKRHVHKDFEFDLEFSDYTRKDYSAEILSHIGKEVNDKTYSSDLADDFLNKLIDYCKIASTEDSASVPSRFVQLTAKYYGKDEQLIFIPPVKGDEFEIRGAQKRLVRLMLNDVSLHDPTWVDQEIKFLKDLIMLGGGYAEYEDIFQLLPIYPNQHYELCKQSSLFIDDEIPEEIKKLYDLVVKPNLSVYSSLIHDDFKSVLKHRQSKSVRDLTEKIEGVFFGGDSQVPISEHTFKKQILAIIEEIKRSPEYAKHFPLVYTRRSAILVDLADGDDTFSILSLNSTAIRELASLAQDPNFNEILKLGREAVIAQKRETAENNYLYAIGTYIERIMREGLSELLSESITAVFKNVQNGQDIIIKINDIPVYYIEVKSRWSVDSSVRLSRNQTIRADEYKDVYSLCTVDMTKFDGNNPLDVTKIEEIENCIWFGTDIGYQVNHLIGILKQEIETDSIHLDGDYRTLVPMSYIESGIRLKQFESYITDLLKPNHQLGSV